MTDRDDKQGETPSGQEERERALVPKAERAAEGEVAAGEPGALSVGESAEAVGGEAEPQVDAVEVGAEGSDAQVDNGESGEGGQVIDLEEARRRLEEKRQQMEGLEGVLSQILSPSQHQSVNVHVDEQFFKEHGSALVQQLIDGLSKVWVPPKVQLTLPMSREERKEAAEKDQAESKGPPDAAGESASDSAVRVSVNVDLAKLLARLFRVRKKGPDDNSADS